MSAGSSDIPIEDALEKHLAKKIRIFISDKAIMSQLQNFLQALKFTNVEVAKVDFTYKGSIVQLAPILFRDDDLVIVSPPLSVATGKTVIKKDITDFFTDVKFFLENKGKMDTVKYLSKCVPIFSEAKLIQIREKCLLSLSELGVTAAFILKKQESMVGLSQSAAKEKKNELMIDRFNEIKGYLIEYFSEDRDDAISKIKERLDEKDLSKKKGEADGWMKKGQQLKEEGRFEEAIVCYRKAIDTYPQDAESYIESGRTYIKVNKHGRALGRFKEAKEVAEELPTPDKEIGNLVMMQVKAKIKGGADPNSPEIKKYLSAAVNSYKTALSKASTVKKINPDGKREPDKEALGRVAGDIFRTDVSSILGPKHEIVKELGALARESFKNSKNSPPEELHPAQLVTLALAAIDQSDFLEAEKLLFIAAADREFLSDAAEEINYLGTRVRKEQREDEAIGIYTRLLKLNPPNQAAIHYNLSVAWKKKGEDAKSAGSIMKALYIDPDLSKEDSFYKSPEIHALLRKLIGQISFADKTKGTMKIKPEISDFYSRIKEIESAYFTNKNETAKLLFKTLGENQAFLSDYKVISNKLLMIAVKDTHKQLAANPKPQTEAFAKLLETAMTNAEKTRVPSKTVNLTNLLSLARKAVLIDKNEELASYYLASLIYASPDVSQEPDLYACKELHTVISGMKQALSHIEIEKFVQ
jgi:tetratricopeptide (TPR) repeat protein